MTNHYTLIIRDRASDARVERAFEDPLQRRVPSTAAWARACREATDWGRAHGYRCVVHEIVDAVTGLSFGQHYVPIRQQADADSGFHLLQDAAEKFRLAGRTALAERIEEIIESESLYSLTPEGR